MKRALIFALLFLTSRASAQTLKVDAGSSSLFGASGAQITSYFPTNTSFVSGGIYQGHVVYGAGTEFLFHDWRVDAGDRTENFSSGLAGLAIDLRGVALERKRKNGSLAFFSGACGRVYSSPFFVGASAREFCAGYFAKRQIGRGLELSSIGVRSLGKSTGLASLAWHWRPLTLQGSGGLLENHPYGSGSLNLSTRHAGFSASHVQFVGDTPSTADNVSAIGSWSAFDVHGSVFESSARGQRNDGTAYGLGANLGVVSAHADWYRSRFGNNAVQIVTERVAPTLQVLQSFTESNGKLNFSMGAAYAGRRFGVSVSRQETYDTTAVGRSPWQQSLNVTLSFNIHDTAATVATNTTPDGKTKWSSYGSQWAYLPGSPQAGQRASVGKNVVTISATDTEGKPVEGVAVSVGKVFCLTNSQGECFVRTRKARAESLTVLLDSFSVPGNWRVVSAPKTVEQTATVVVEKVLQ